MSDKPAKIRVRVKKEIVESGAGFHDFYSNVDLYAKKPSQIFTVEQTPFIRQKLMTGELILVTEPVAKKDDKKDEKKDDKKDETKVNDKGKTEKKTEKGK